MEKRSLQSKAAPLQWCVYMLLMFPDKYTRALWGYVNKKYTLYNRLENLIIELPIDDIS